MSTNRKITIFLASSEELINDRNSFSDLIRALDDIYEDRGIRVKLKRWEDFFAYCTGTRTQDEYNQVLSASDMCICLFHKRAGQYTIEEFHHAIAEYQRTGDHPKTYVYARALVEGEIEEEELKQFKDELFKQMGHYWCNYATEDSMKLHFVMQFEHLLNGDTAQSNLKVDGGSVMLHGRKIADYANLPFASDNNEMRILIDKIASLDKEVAEYRAMNIESLRPTIIAKLTERNECQKQLDQLKDQLLDMALTISKIISGGNPIGERKRLAIEMFETGNNKGILDVLNEADIASEHERAKAELAYGKQLVKIGEEMIAAAEQKIRSLVEELIMKAKTWMSTFSEPNRVSNACKCYENAIQYTRDSLPKKDLANILFSYASFLQNSNLFHLPIETYYEEAMDVFLTIAEMDSCEEIDMKILGITHNLSWLYSNSNRFFDAEQYSIRTMDLYELLSKKYNKDYSEGLAATLTNLAILYVNIGDLTRAESIFLKALNIINEQLLQKNRNLYEPHIAFISDNLATVYCRLERYASAERYYRRALEILERLCMSNPQQYEPFLANTLSNFGILYSDLNDFTNSKNYQCRAVEIYERLAYDEPEVHEPRFADVLINLANMYTVRQYFLEAEKYYIRALEIYERLSLMSPDFYRSALADTLNNIGSSYSMAGRYNEAEKMCIRAVNIYVELAESQPAVYEKLYVLSLWNLYLIYDDSNNSQSASILLESAKELFESS